MKERRIKHLDFDIAKLSMFEYIESGTAQKEYIVFWVILLLKSGKIILREYYEIYSIKCVYYTNIINKKAPKIKIIKQI